MHDDVTFEPFRDWRDSSAMPAGSERNRQSARKRTYRSERARKKIGRSAGGMRKRRHKRID